jgi:hypothetical protein
MNKRLFVFFNFFAFNLLFFALYLNFIYKDVAAAVPTLQVAPTEVKSGYEPNSIKPGQKEKVNLKSEANSHPVIKKDSEALRLSMN